MGILTVVNRSKRTGWCVSGKFCSETKGGRGLKKWLKGGAHTKGVPFLKETFGT